MRGLIASCQSVPYSTTMQWPLAQSAISERFSFKLRIKVQVAFSSPISRTVKYYQIWTKHKNTDRIPARCFAASDSSRLQVKVAEIWPTVTSHFCWSAGEHPEANTKEQQNLILTKKWIWLYKSWVHAPSYQTFFKMLFFYYVDIHSMLFGCENRVAGERLATGRQVAAAAYWSIIIVRHATFASANRRGFNIELTGRGLTRSYRRREVWLAISEFNSS